MKWVPMITVLAEKGKPMRLIDADSLTKRLQHLWNTHDYVDFNKKDVRDVWDELENTPTIDAVEVVRCKDCRYKPVGTGCNHDLEFPVHYKCPCECDDYWYSWMPKDNFFCGNGERKKTDG